MFFSSPPPPPKDIYFGGNQLAYLIAIFAFVGHERIFFPFKMVMLGKFKGTLQYRQVPLVEILLLPVSVDRALTLSVPHLARNEGLGSQVDPTLVDAVV